MNDPKISVIVPAYNIEAYLPNCLDSILAQTYPELEIVVVNDGSSDGTPAIADSYAEKFPGRFLVLHQENTGVARARLNGVAAAHGEWIGFVDGDDEIEPDMYQRLMANALKYDADISHCGYQTIVNGGERIHYFYDTGKLAVQDHKDGLKDLIEGTFIEPSLCNKLFRKDLLTAEQPIPELYYSLRNNEDLLLNYHLFSRAEKSVYEDFCPYHYLAHVDSVTRSGGQDYKVFDPLCVKKWLTEHTEGEVRQAAVKKYLESMVYTYSEAVDDRETAGKLREMLRVNKDRLGSMDRKNRIKARMILTLPEIYKAVFRFYRKHYQKKNYE